MLKTSATRVRANRVWVGAFCAVAALAIIATASFTFLPANHRGAVATKSRLLTPAAQDRVRASFAALPLAFEQNKGQTDAEVKYMARGDGYTLFLTPNDAVFSLRSRSPAKSSTARMNALHPGLGLHTRSSSPQVSSGAQKDLTAVVRMQLTGANSPAKISATNQMPGKSNYFVGSDKSKWQTDVTHYARVSYESVYPGVDLAFHGVQHHTEFDFVVAPQANPAPIGFHFTGAQGIKTDDSGNLVIASAAGNILLHKPVAYQEQNGARQPVDARFVLKAGNQVAFELGTYDRSRELVIDPSVSYLYSTYLGGSGEDYGYGIAFDTNGNSYVTGQTTSTNFPGASNTLTGTLGNAFVTKIASDGSSLVYSTYVGGSGSGGFGDSGNAIAVDSSGNAFVTGGTYSSDFPHTTGVFQTTLSGASDAFVFELGSSGAIIYSTYLGGTGLDSGLGIATATDNSGDVFVVGSTYSTDFPTFPSAPLQAYLAGSTRSGFIAKINSSASAFVYSSYVGGSQPNSATGDAANAVAVDSSNNAYVTGQTFSSTFTTTTNAFQSTCAGCSGGNSNAFVRVINATATAYVYSTFLGGSSTDVGLSVAVDSAGDAYVTGEANSSDFPTTAGALQTTYGGATDAFVTKLNPTGTSPLLYSTYLGGSGNDLGVSIGVDGGGIAYVTGQTNSTGASPSGFPTTTTATQATLGGGNDAFVSEINPAAPAGSQLVFSTYLGGSADEDDSGIQGAIAVDGPGANIYVTGNTASTNFPTTTTVPYAGGSANGGAAGTADAFVTKYSQPAFSIAATTPTAVSAGGSATSSVTVSSFNGYASAVTLSCSVTGTGSPLPQCSVTGTNPVTPPAGGQVTSTLTVTTSGSTPNRAASRSRSIFYAMWLPVAGLSLVGMGLSTSRSRRKKMFGFLMLGVMIGTLSLIAACGGSSSSSTTPTCAAAPSAPTGLAASNTTSTGTSLAWTASTVGANCSVSSYTVYQNGTSIGTSTTPSFTVTGLTGGTTYSFTAAATDAAGTSAQSSALSVTTPASQTPSGSYTITITGTDASSRSQSAQVTLTVN